MQLDNTIMLSKFNKLRATKFRKQKVLKTTIKKETLLKVKLKGNN